MRRSFVVSILAVGTLVVGLAGSSPAQQRDVRKVPGVEWSFVPSSDPDLSEGRIVSVKRAKVPGGWLVHVRSGETTNVTFLPDPTHGWLRPEPTPAATKTPQPTPAPPQPSTLATPKPPPSYFEQDGSVPKAERVDGLPWLRKRPGITYAPARRIPTAVYRKYQSFKQAYKLAQECGGEFTVDGYRINWMQKTSFLSTGLGLRVGDVLRSVNGQRFGQHPSELHAALRGKRRFALLILRKGRPLVLPYLVPRWLGEKR